MYSCFNFASSVPHIEQDSTAVTAYYQVTEAYGDSVIIAIDYIWHIYHPRRSSWIDIYTKVEKLDLIQFTPCSGSADTPIMDSNYSVGSPGLKQEITHSIMDAFSHFRAITG